MIDVKELKTRYDEIAKNIKDRYMNVDLDKIVKDQEERAALLLEVENLRSKRNETAQKMKQKLDNETRYYCTTNAVFSNNYSFPTIEMNGTTYLMLFEDDIMYVIADYEEREDKEESSIITPKEDLII